MTQARLITLTALLLAGCTVSVGDGSPSAQNQAGGPATSQGGSAPSGQTGQAGQAGQAGEVGGADQAGQAGGQGTAGQATGAQGGAAAAGAGGGEASACGDVPVTGRCVDGQTLERCVTHEGAGDQAGRLPEVVRAACKAGMVCKQDDGGAYCAATTACDEGQTSCEGGATLLRCQGGAWVSEPCGQQVCKIAPSGAACSEVADQLGQTYPITGRLRYERYPINDDRTGYAETASVDDARWVMAVAYDGDEYLGGTYTSPEDGSFTIDASKKPSAQTSVFFYPMYFPDDSAPQFAVARPKTLTYANLTSDAYWSWGFATGGQQAMGELVITDQMGSGAVHIHQWVLYALQQAELALPDKKPFNVVALFEPGQRFDCGNGTCYTPRGWGASVDYGGGVDQYTGALLIAGTEASPHQWSASVILHELGHYFMDSYSRTPAEAGRHSTTMLEPPGQAWSEGWATFIGQSTMLDNIYFDKQEGTSWWFDVSSPRQSVPMPDPAGPLDQELGELAVAAMLWALWDATPVQQAASWDASSISSDRVWKAFSADRMTKASENRGYKTVDLVDMLDALRCEGATAAEVSSVTSHFGFPYDDGAVCK